MNNHIHDLLQKAFEKKKQDFKGISLRWLASKLSVSHTYIFQIMSGKRSIPVKLVEPLCEVLDLDDETRLKVFQSVYSDKGYPTLKPKAQISTPEDWKLAPLKDFKLLDHWESLAVLQATHLDEYDGTCEFISTRLKISMEKVQAVVADLKEKNYLENQNGVLKAAHRLYDFQSRASKEQIRSYHKAALGKAQSVLETKTTDGDVEKRLITSALVTCSRSQIPELKRKITEFMRELVAEAALDEADNIYQFGVHFFPISDQE